MVAPLADVDLIDASMDYRLSQREGLCNVLAQRTVRRRRILNIYYIPLLFFAFLVKSFYDFSSYTSFILRTPIFADLVLNLTPKPCKR